ncbi:UvrD-helicase domain-containing protein [bacterium]|nr:UvrD-helicase domain-containing protein [bacterium]
MSLTPEQALAAHAPGSVAVTAGAGTGKTHMLTARYRYHLEQHGLSPLEIVAVTFTKKAAAELRARIREMVATTMQATPELVAEIEAAPISTLHVLAARICREHPEAAEVPPDFSVLDELEGALWREERIAELLLALPEALLDAIPFALLDAAIRAFLADPWTAEQALARDPAAWGDRVQQARQAACKALLASSDWRQLSATVRALVGPEGDAIENTRRMALEALTATEEAHAAGASLRPALEALTTLPMRGGSKKTWGEENFAAIKEALKALRELAGDALKAGLVVLELGESDRLLAACLPALREAFAIAMAHMAQAKQEARVLEFSDLELGALRALRHPEIAAYYAVRWKAYMVDEFQDTNPVQAELLERLVGGAILTVVGDEKQAIYGFRRADVEVFRRFCARIVEEGGLHVSLTQSFRTHEGLLTPINRLFEPVLGELHQALVAARSAHPAEAPVLTAFAVETDKDLHRGADKASRQRAEAKRLAKALKDQLAAGTPVFDKASGQLRPMRPGDVAILARTWDPLDVYGEALAAEGIPFVHAGGGSLMETREAQDGWALLRFLASPEDDLALVAVVRSPFFALSDRTLYAFAAELPADGGYWRALSGAEDLAPEWRRVKEVLTALLSAARMESASRALQEGDRHCGYTAVLANLPNPARRLADWRAFCDFVRGLEGDGTDLFPLVRRLRCLLLADLNVPRPALEARDAVALMTVHASKGLEWPLVVVPDLARSAPASRALILMDAAWGVALGLGKELGSDPALYTILKEEQRAREAAEAKRVMYVAFTRARDYLMLAATDPKGGSLEFLAQGLETAGLCVEALPYHEADALPPEPVLPPLPPSPERYLPPIRA